MQNVGKYQIINEKNLDVHKIESELCVLSFSQKPDKQKIVALINANPNVQFWLSTPNMDREDVIFANQMGIQNVLPYPLEIDTVDKYISGLKLATEKNEHNSFNLPPLTNAKLMVVDDNIMNIELIEETLRGLGINIEVYTQPKNAIEQIQQNSYDLFLLDILMPEISGFDIAEEIKNSNLNKNSPIMFISALSDYEYKISGYNVGACFYIEKPFDVKILRRQVYNVLKEEELKKHSNQSKDKYLAMITHDLKTPITAEINALKLLLKNSLGQLNEPQQEIISDILSSAKFLKSLTDNILCSYKHKSSQLELSTETCNFIKLITDSIEETKYLLKDKELQIQFKTNLSHANISLDIIEIKRVINNLIGNAADYAPFGSKIELDLSKIGNEYLFSISDSGCGIKLENPNDIFDCNMTLAKESKRIGFGLGLFISKNIVESHGGRIFAESKIGEGTKITFSLPA